MSIFRIFLTASGLTMTAIYLLFWVGNSFRVSRVFYNNNGIELPGLLVQRPFFRPVFFPFEAGRGFASRIIYKEDEAWIRSMTAADAVGRLNAHMLYLPDAVLDYEPSASQTQDSRLTLDPKEIVICKDTVSWILERRWIACYMLYDWNIRHADFAFDSNEMDRYQQVCRKLQDKKTDAAPMETVLTDIYNQVLLDDVEDFIQIHMRVQNCDRLRVELEIVRTLAELYHTDEV